MLDVGLGVRLIVAAAPAPPVPAPPGKPPFPLSSSSSSLRRRCSSWWFFNGNAHGRDTTTTTTTSSRATRRRWWSDPDGSQEEYGSSSLEEDDYDYEDEAALSGFGWAGQLLDESWFSQVFKTYGVLLPVMLTSMFAATGLKAFLMAMAIPLSQSAISSFLLRRKGNRDDWWGIFFKKNYRWRRPFQEEECPEDATDFATGGRGNGYSSSSSSSSSSNNNYYEGRRRRHNYQSWVSKDFAAAAASTAVGADDNTNSNSSGDGGGNKNSGGYGGWDELLDNNIAAAQEAKRSSKPATHSQLATLITARNRGLQRLRRKLRIITAAGGGGRVEQGVGAPRERTRMRRRGMPRTMGLGSTRYKQAPLLMRRLLVAVFPFLRSWFRLL